MRKFYFLLLFALLGIVANAQIFKKVTDVSTLQNGDKVVIVYEAGSKAMGAQSGKYRGVVDVVISDFMITDLTAGAAVLTVGKESDGTFTFNDGTGYLEYHGSGNELYTQDGNIYWNVTAEKITNAGITARTLQYNTGSPRFACYTNTQKDVCLYKESNEAITKTATPAFSLAEGTYYDVQTVELSCATDNSTITYKINDEQATEYSSDAPIQLTENGSYTITAWATADGLDQSDNATAVYTIEKTCAEPEFSLKSGSYMVAQTLELTCATDGAVINYTVNEGGAQVYNGTPIALDENGTFTVKAWSTKAGYTNSAEVTREYVMDIVDGLVVEDFDFVTIGQTNGYPTDDNNNSTGGTPEFNSGEVHVSTTSTGTPNRFWENWTEYRMYKGATLTFSVPANYTIVRIELTPASTSFTGNGYSDGIWTGEAQSVTLTHTGTSRVDFTDFIVYYKPLAQDQVLAPEFSLTSGTYEGNQELAMTCATDGAEIHYVVNDEEEKIYDNTPIALTAEVGTYTIKAWATKADMTQSTEVTANYTIVEPLVASTIAEFKTLGAATENKDRFITMNCALTVTYQNGGNGTRDLYVKDAAGDGLLIYEFNNPGFSAGDVIPAGLKGKYDNYNGLVELVDPENFGVVTETVTVVPEVKTTAEVTADDMSKLIVINDVTLSSLSNKNGTLTDAVGSITVRDNGYFEYPADLEKRYNVTAVVAIYKDNIQLYPVLIEEVSMEQVATPVFSLASGTYDGDQQLELTCVTDGAEIHYVVNDEEEKIYDNTPISLTAEVGTYTIKAWATKADMTQSTEVTANYTIVEPLVASTIAEFKTLGAATENKDRFITMNCALTVTYQNGGNGTRDLYVKDAAGDGLLIYEFNNPEFSAGDVIPAGLKGKYDNYNGLVELVDPENFGEVTETATVVPEIKTVAEVTADDMSKLIVINDVTLSALNDKGDGTITDASGSIALFDKYSYENYPADLDKKYNVTVVVSYYNNLQLYPVAIEEVVVPEQVASPEFSLEAGTYEGEQTLELTCATEGATINYTVNGGEPQVYDATEKITLAVGEYEIVAWAVKDGMTDSEKVTQSYEITEVVGLSSVQSGTPAVYATDGAVVVSVEKATLVYVYNMAGQSVKNVEAAAGKTEISLASGMYIVKAGEKAVKVVVGK